ncbi:MAG: hypothetical protein GXO07_06430 [Crenarchaeota archaeon]|nr:hypothetical protein [Thermoproteota archaeon]
MRIIVGNTLAARCFDGIVIDPVHADPYPLRKIRVGDKNVPMMPIIVERCPERTTCVELKGDEVILKDGSHAKACKGFKCQDPWPKRWTRFQRKYLVTNISIEKAANILPAGIKSLKEGKLLLSGWKTVEFDELIWTAPYDALARLLGAPSPRSLEATVAVFEASADWSIAYHLGNSNPFYAVVKLQNIAWALGPGTFDVISALKHLERKGYLKVKRYLASFTINYYALEEAEVRAPEWIKLFGRTAEWRERSLEELLC